MTHELAAGEPPIIDGQQIEDSYSVISPAPIDTRIAGVALEHHLRQFDPQDIKGQLRWVARNLEALSNECGRGRVQRFFSRLKDSSSRQSDTLLDFHFSPEPEHRDPMHPSIIRR